MESKWITFNEVVEVTGLNKRTAERRLKLFRERHAELYSLISKAIGRKKFYLDPSIIKTAEEELIKRRGANFTYEALLGDRNPPLEYRVTKE